MPYACKNKKCAQTCNQSCRCLSRTSGTIGGLLYLASDGSIQSCSDLIYNPNGNMPSVGQTNVPVLTVPNISMATGNAFDPSNFIWTPSASSPYPSTTNVMWLNQLGQLMVDTQVIGPLKSIASFSTTGASGSATANAVTTYAPTVTTPDPTGAITASGNTITLPAGSYNIYATYLPSTPGYYAGYSVYHGFRVTSNYPTTNYQATIPIISGTEIQVGTGQSSSGADVPWAGSCSVIGPATLTPVVVNKTGTSVQSTVGFNFTITRVN